MNCDAVLRVVCRTTHRTLNDAIPSFVHISVHSNNDLTACGLRAAVRSNGTLRKRHLRKSFRLPRRAVRVSTSAVGGCAYVGIPRHDNQNLSQWQLREGEENRPGVFKPPIE